MVITHKAFQCEVIGGDDLCADLAKTSFQQSRDQGEVLGVGGISVDEKLGARLRELSPAGKLMQKTTQTFSHDTKVLVDGS